MKIWNEWVEAAKVLAADPTAQVLCPRSSDAFLEIADTPMGDGRVERELRCPTCGARNVIRNPTGLGRAQAGGVRPR